MLIVNPLYVQAFKYLMDNVALIVNNRVMDATTKEEIETKNEFVQLLTHPSYILQIAKLPPKRLTSKTGLLLSEIKKL